MEPSSAGPISFSSWHPSPLTTVTTTDVGGVAGGGGGIDEDRWLARTGKSNRFQSDSNNARSLLVIIF